MTFLAVLVCSYDIHPDHCSHPQRGVSVQSNVLRTAFCCSLHVKKNNLELTLVLSLHTCSLLANVFKVSNGFATPYEVIVHLSHHGLRFLCFLWILQFRVYMGAHVWIMMMCVCVCVYAHNNKAVIQQAKPHIVTCTTYFCDLLHRFRETTPP